MKSGARGLAYHVLLEVEENGAYVNLALQQAFRQSALEDRDRALSTEIVYGTVQRRRSLDVLLQMVCHRPVEKLDKGVLTILRMTAYQLAFLTKIPAYAALNEAVEICKNVQKSAAGFVNGVLRSFQRDERDVGERLRSAAVAAGSLADEIGIQYSYPTWLVEDWLEAYGKERTLSLAKACNEHGSLSVRVNLARGSRARILPELKDEYGSAAEPSVLSEQGVRFRQGIDVDKWAAFRQGEVTVQDEASMVIVPLLMARQGQHILDMCAGPGTKTTQIAEMQLDGGIVDACDIHVHKLKLLHHAADRLGLASIRTLLMDARLLPARPDLREKYDAVLLDAPCSGLGVLRHRPDIRWRRSRADSEALCRLQLELLSAAIALVKQGGVIVYSTCTILPRENEAVIQAALTKANGKVRLDDLQNELPMVLREHVSKERCGVLIAPDLYGTDGFYAARLRKL